jgi:hypothetical protein
MLEFFIQGVTYLLKNESYSTDSRELSSIVTYHSQSNCQMRNRQITHFSNKNIKMASKREKNMLRQPYILQINHLESNVSVLNLVTLSL